MKIEIKNDDKSKIRKESHSLTSKEHPIKKSEENKSMKKKKMNRKNENHPNSKEDLQ